MPVQETDAAAQAAAGKADVLQVGALCNCTHALIDMARMQFQANDKQGTKRQVPWLE